ncbi:hypothetical protein D3C84_1240960 [compost metagenome]
MEEVGEYRHFPVPVTDGVAVAEQFAVEVVAGDLALIRIHVHQVDRVEGLILITVAVDGFAHA